MKFSEKYELLESLTTGAIETFVANDKIRGERVLVHIVECPPQNPDQSNAEWALESFRKVAPEPSGPVLETGKYAAPKYAYVVVKPADEAAAKAWVRRYELQADETRETKAHTLKKEISAPPDVAPTPIALKEPPQPSGSMTQLLRDFDSLVKSKSSETPTLPDLPPVKPASSTNLPGESGLHAAPAWDQSPAKPIPQSKEPLITAPPIPSVPAAADSSAPSGRNSAKPGEFTGFFQGPFRGDRASDVPSFTSQPIEPPKKSVGEFTALFGGATPPSAATPAATGSPDGSFTSIFKDIGNSQPTFNPAPPLQGAVIPPAAPPAPSVPPLNVAPLPDPVFVAPTPIPVVTPTPSSAPAIPPSRSPIERPVPPRPASIPSDGATGAFMRPPAGPEPIPAEAPSGPSPYTQIISRPRMSEPGESEGGKAPAASAGKVGSPSMPKIPGVVPPPMPKMPPLPRLAPPPAPMVKAPPAPKIPKVDVPAPPPVSMWPLIITLTVLFFLAVILVLYFVLRH